MRTARRKAAAWVLLWRGRLARLTRWWSTRRRLHRENRRLLFRHHLQAELLAEEGSINAELSFLMAAWRRAWQARQLWMQKAAEMELAGGAPLEDRAMLERSEAWHDLQDQLAERTRRLLDEFSNTGILY